MILSYNKELLMSIACEKLESLCDSPKKLYKYYDIVNTQPSFQQAVGLVVKLYLADLNKTSQPLDGEMYIKSLVVDFSRTW